MIDDVCTCKCRIETFLDQNLITKYTNWQYFLGSMAQTKITNENLK